MAEEVGFEPTGQIKAGTTDFKSVRLCPLAHSSIMQGFSYPAQSHSALLKTATVLVYGSADNPLHYMAERTPATLQALGTFTFYIAIATIAGAGDGTRTRTL